MSRAVIYLIEADGYNPNTLQVERLSLCTGAGFTTAPTDTPPSTVYLPRIKQAGSLKCSMFEGSGASGKSSVGFGEVTFSNADGALDYLKTWGFDGRDLVCKIGYDGDPVSSFPILYRATMQQAKPERDIFTLALRDRQFILDRPVQDLKFQGTNDLPEGLEGTPNDIMGKPKPLVLGKVFNVTPVCVNTSKLVYALNVRHGGQFDAEPAVDSLPDFDAANIAIDTTSSISISNAYDKGLAITRGADYANSTDMLTTAPAAGTYRVCPTEGYFRLGSTPSGVITVDCMDGTSAATGATACRLVHQVLNQLLSVTDDQISLPDLTAADAVFPGDVGVFIDAETTGGPVLDQIFSAPGHWYGSDRLGIFRVIPMVLPLTDSIMTLDEADIQNDFELLGQSDTPNGVPVKRVNINYRKNYTVQNAAELAGAVDPDRRNQLALQFRQSYAENLDVTVPHQLAGELNFDSSAYDDQTAESERRLGIYSVMRDRLQVRVKMRPGLENLLNLGRNLTVKLSRFGYDAGLIRKIISFDLNCENDDLTLILWG